MSDPSGQCPHCLRWFQVLQVHQKLSRKCYGPREAVAADQVASDLKRSRAEPGNALPSSTTTFDPQQIETEHCASSLNGVLQGNVDGHVGSMTSMMSDRLMAAIAEDGKSLPSSSDALVYASCVFMPGSHFRRALTAQLHVKDSKSSPEEMLQRKSQLRAALKTCLVCMKTFRRGCIKAAIARRPGKQFTSRTLGLAEEMEICLPLVDDWIESWCEGTPLALVTPISEGDNGALVGNFTGDDGSTQSELMLSTQNLLFPTPDASAETVDGWNAAERAEFRWLAQTVIDETRCDFVSQFDKTYERGFISVAICTVMWKSEPFLRHGDGGSDCRTSPVIPPGHATLVLDHHRAEVFPPFHQQSFHSGAQRVLLEAWR